MRKLTNSPAATDKDVLVRNALMQGDDCCQGDDAAFFAKANPRTTAKESIAAPVFEQRRSDALTQNGRRGASPHLESRC